MIDQTHVRIITVYFHLLVCNQEMAMELSNKAFNQFLNATNKNPRELSDILIVDVCYKLSKELNLSKCIDNNFTFGDRWIGAHKIELNNWIEFVRTTNPEIVMTTLWCLVLEIGYDLVARAMNLSEGTVRFRLGLASRKIGYIVSKNSVRQMSLI
jgi:hypothetical protein